MHIHKLVAENFMKLNIEVEVEGKDVIVTGRNEIGKSTAINLVWYALTGKEIPDEPIQQGQDSAKIQVEVKRPDGTILICTRKFKREGKDSLKVYTAEGATFSSPQAFLNSIIGQISFDCMEFVKMTPLDQKRWLQKALGIDTTELETNKKIKLAELDNYKKQIAQLEKDLELMPEFTTKLEERHITEVADKQKEIKDAERKKQGIKDEITAMQKQQNDLITAETNLSGSIKVNNEKIKQLEAQIKQLAELNEKAEMDIETGKGTLEELQKQITLKGMEHDQVIIPDDSEIQTIVQEIQQHNEKVKQQTLRTNKEGELEKVKASEIKKKEELMQIEQDRIKLIQSVKMPIEGLDFSDDGLTFNGLPFVANQFSTAKMDDIGIDISIALNPGLKILRIKDWGLFDTDRKRTVMEKAKKHGFQVFREQVTDDDQIGFIMEEA